MMYFALGILWVVNLYFTVTSLAKGDMTGIVNLLALVVISVALGKMYAEDV